MKSLLVVVVIIKKYQSWLANYQKLPEKIQQLKNEIEIAEVKVQDELEQSGILQDIEDLESKICRIEETTTLGELGIQPFEAMKLLEANGITPILDESDREIFERPRNYQSKNDLIMVHKTDFIPKNNRLSTQKEAGVERNLKVNLDGKDYEFSYLIERDTVHTSMNDEVSSHMFGEWDHCRYTVLQPFAEVANEKIGATVPNDTYTKGGIDLTANAWILCPANQVDEVKKENPSVHVLGYQGENSAGLAAPFLSQLGYRAEKVGMWGWEDEQSQNQFFQLAEKENLKVQQHNDSVESETEDYLIACNKTISIMKMLRENNLINNLEDYQRIKPQLVRQVGYNECMKKAMTGRELQILQQKMEKAGMPIVGKNYEILKTAYDDKQNDTNLVTEKFGIELGFSEIFEKAMINSAVNSYTQEAERAM